MIQEALDFGDILEEEDNTPHCKNCGNELIVDINWYKSNFRDNHYNCNDCLYKSNKKLKAAIKEANLDPNKVWDPEFIKTCTLCKTELNAEKNFFKNVYSPDGFNCWCRVCYRKEEQKVKRKFSRQRTSARRRGYDWTLTFEDCSGLFLDNCHYCGKHSVEEVKLNGLDRVDNNRGYHIDNVVTCCEQCNVAKHTQTYEEFIQQSHNIAQRHPLNKEKLNVDWTKGYLEYSEVGENNI